MLYREALLMVNLYHDGKVKVVGEVAEADGAAKGPPQETVFSLTIQPTVGDSFDLQFVMMRVMKLWFFYRLTVPRWCKAKSHQVLLEREATCPKTCFSLQLNGVTLGFSEIRAVVGLVDGSVLHVVEEPYTMREARIHLRHVRDLLKNGDQADAASAVDLTSRHFCLR
ncbi:unnamed protein product [Cylicostephanus goldi]|uniref:Clustered mitochondria protein N-terminal domain-containing protein n=1 Tax=Cylicostephanus goldi TaxID=71465 RepID=A0A3P6QDY2_CYLGO|nr:unnamed protein product [Cylicostephanus goldi]